MRRTTLLLLCSLGCGGPGTDVDAGGPIVFVSTFESGSDEWTADFADYPPGEETFYALIGEVRDMPLAGGGARGFFLSGDNHSDDLWMAIVRRLRDLAPDTPYELRFTIDVASNAPTGCIGIGGSPGESVSLKAGGSAAMLATTTDANGNVAWVVPDKGIQENAGVDSIVLGDMANGLACPDETWVLLMRSGSLAVRSDAAGEMTVFVGTDSGFEGTSSFYYDRVRIELVPL